MNPVQYLTGQTIEAVKALYGAEVSTESLQFQATRKEF